VRRARESTKWLDLRLVPGTLAAWAAVVWGLRSGFDAVVVASVCCAGAAMCCLLIGRRKEAANGLGLALAVTAIALAPLAVRLHQARTSELALLAVQRASGVMTATVTSDPRMLTARGEAGAVRVAVNAKVHQLTSSGKSRRVSGSVLILAPADGWRQVMPGQRIQVDAQLSPPLRSDLLTAVASVRAQPEAVGRPPWWQRGAEAIRAGLQRASSSLPDGARGLLPGLVVGDVSQMDPVLAEHFRRAGLTHLVAVSGSNCSIVVGAVSLVLVRLRASPRMIALLSGVVLLGFVVIVRPEASVLRAAAMTAIGLVSLAAGRQRSALPVLAGATFLLLLYRPVLAVDVGFALSVAATAALVTIAPGWAEALRARRVPPGLAEAAAIATAAHVVTAPIVAAITGQISLVAIPANILAEPVVAVTTIVGMLAAVCSPVCLPIACLLAWVAAWPCRWIVLVGDHFGSLQGSAVPWPAGYRGAVLLAVVTLAGVLAARRRRPRTLIAIGLSIAILVQIPGRIVVGGWPPAGALFVACDIGQGDAGVIPIGPRSAMVIDAGPSPVAIGRCLDDLRITKVPLLVLTHFHIDHVGGLAGVLHGREIGEVVFTEHPSPQSGQAIVADTLAEHQIKARTTTAGQSWVLGHGDDQASVKVLWPVHPPLSGTRSDANNASIVLLVTTHGRRILLPGDVEVEGQDWLLHAEVDVQADVLKVPHHGSAYSDPAFLRAVHPAVAVVSVGKGNSYGHPSPLLLAAFAADGVPLHRTDQDGDVAVVQRHGALATLTRRVPT
jgi:competence protein ComEC